MSEPSAITRDWIAQASDEELDWTIWLYIVRRIEERGLDHEDEVLATLPKGLQAFYDAYDLCREIDNNGFATYFYNKLLTLPDDEVVPQARKAVAALRWFGADEHAALADNALAIYVRESDERPEIWADYGDVLSHSAVEQLDSRFSTDQLTRRMREYIRSEPDEFIHP